MKACKLMLNPQSSGGELIMMLFLSLPCCRAELGGGGRPTVPVSLDCEPTNTLCIDVYREWRGLFTSIGGVIERPLFRSVRVQERRKPIRKAGGAMLISDTTISWHVEPL